MLTKLAVWYLTRKKVSVLIGYDIMFNRVRPIHKKAFIYNSNLTNVNYQHADSTEYIIPVGKFEVEKSYED